MTEARERTLPLLGALTGLVPGAALQRGTTVACSGSAAMSLAMTVIAGPVRGGSWAAIAGVPTFGLRAAGELGVTASRLVRVAPPAGGLDANRWADAVGAMIDGFDLVVLGPELRVRPQVARRLQSRAQSRGAVLLTVGAPDGFGADVQLVGLRQWWDGLGDGHGVATARRVEVEVRGRRVPRAQRAMLWLPDADGELRVEAAPVLTLARTG